MINIPKLRLKKYTLVMCYNFDAETLRKVTRFFEKI